MEIAQDFYNSLQIDAELKDVTFTGSLANYNWSKYSDIDLHLIVDYKDVEGDPELVETILMPKNQIGTERTTFSSMDTKLKYMCKTKTSHIHLLVSTL